MSPYVFSREQCSSHNIFPGVNIHTLSGETMTISLVEFEPHATVEPHSHPHEQMGILLTGNLTFVIAGESHPVHAGGMWRIPGGVEHSAIAGSEAVQAIDIFHPVRADYQ